MNIEKYILVEELITASLSNAVCSLFLTSDSSEYDTDSVLSILQKLNGLSIYDMLFMPKLVPFFSELSGSEVYILEDAAIYFRTHLDEELYVDLIKTTASAATHYAKETELHFSRPTKDIRSSGEADYVLDMTILERLDSLAYCRELLEKNPVVLYLNVLRLHPALVLDWYRNNHQKKTTETNIHSVPVKGQSWVSLTMVLKNTLKSTSA